MLQHLRRSYHVLAAAAEAGRPIDEVRPSQRTFVLILGNEEAAASRATLDGCDRVATILGSGLTNPSMWPSRRRFSCILSRDKV
jgi:tRNA G18 (ribose-2'-O)-methylase SpoU